MLVIKSANLFEIFFIFPFLTFMNVLGRNDKVNKI